MSRRLRTSRTRSPNARLAASGSWWNGTTMRKGAWRLRPIGQERTGRERDGSERPGLVALVDQAGAFKVGGRADVSRRNNTEPQELGSTPEEGAQSPAAGRRSSPCTGRTLREVAGRTGPTAEADSGPRRGGGRPVAAHGRVPRTNPSRRRVDTGVVPLPPTPSTSPESSREPPIAVVGSGRRERCRSTRGWPSDGGRPLAKGSRKEPHDDPMFVQSHGAGVWGACDAQRGCCRRGSYCCHWSGRPVREWEGSSCVPLTSTQPARHPYRQAPGNRHDFAGRPPRYRTLAAVQPGQGRRD